MRAAALAAAAAFAIGTNAAALDPRQVINAKVTDTLTTTLTKTKQVKETQVVISTTTKIIKVTDKVIQTVTVTVGSSTGSIFPTVTSTVTQSVTAACPSTPATTSATTTSSTSTTRNTSFTTTAIETATGTAGLADYAAAAGLEYFGTAVDYPGTGEGSDPIYLEVALNEHEFDQFTPANVMKWFSTEPTQGVFNFSDGDAFVAFAGDRKIRCHNLVWHSQIPSWLQNGNWTRDSLLDIMYNHIEALMVHFGDHCYHWDVVNEALADGPPADGSRPWRNSIFQRIIGPDFVELAFRRAAEVRAAHNINTKLYYNDYSIEWPGAKTNNAAILARNLTGMGVEIDGIGMQSHFTISGTPNLQQMAGSIANYTNKVNTVTGKNLEVALTELDIRASSLPVSYEQQVQQKTDYRDAVGACVTSDGCIGITLWDFDDRYSWVPYTFAGQGYALPWFLPENATHLVKKIAFDGIVEGLGL